MTNTAKRNLTQFILLLGAVILIAGVTALLVWALGGRCEVLTQIILSISVMGLGWLILSVTHRWMKKSLCKLGLFGVLYIFGVCVYGGVLVGSEWSAIRIFSPIDNTLSIFFPSRGSYSDALFDNNIWFYLLHLLSYLFFAMIVFSWFGRRLVNRSGRFLILPCHKNVFWGHSEGSVLLAKDIMLQDSLQQVVFVLPLDIKEDEEKEKRIFEQLDGLGIVVSYMDMDAQKRVRAHRHFFLTDNQDANVQTALKVALSEKVPGVSLYVRTELPQAYTLFKDAVAEVHIFNQSALTARQFAKKFPMLECAGNRVSGLRVSHNFKVLLLGFGWTGRELLHKEICDSQYVGSTFSATIFDSDYETRYGDYPTLYGECITEYNLCFNPDIPDSEQGRVVGSRAFYKWCEEHLMDYDRVLVALGDDSRNLNVAMTLAQIARYETAGQPVDPARKTLFAHVREPQHYAYCCDESYPIEIFGDLKDIYSVGVVIDESLDRMAKAVNCVYDLYKQPVVSIEDIKQQSESCWRGNTKALFERDSSRAAAANIDNIFSLVEKSELSFEDAVKSPALLDILAETEHLRWNAFHFTNEVRRWVLSEMPDNHKKDAKLFSVPDDKVYPLLKHACLVSFKDLKDVSKRVNEIREKNGITEKENFQKTDLRIIRHFAVIREFANNAMRSKHTYNPRPFGTSSVKLPAELGALQEDLARNVHEVWAKGRMAEGWTYGSVRNDALKQHPCLVPYDELPENERDYDRRTALETLRVIQKLGWRIEK